MDKTFRPGYLFLALIIFPSLISCTLGQKTRTFLAQQAMQEELQQILDTWRVQSNVPGAVVGFSLSEGSEIVLASGGSDIRNDVAMEADDQFQIASITKTFLAAETLLLASEQKLDLDAPLKRYWNEVPHGDVVTIRHLLSHRSGYFDPLHDDPGFIRYLAEDLERRWSWHEMLRITFEQDLFFSPGSDYRYSNANYLLLALVIEKITQKPLREVLTSRFISPLGLAHTEYRTVETDVNQTDLVHGYATHPVTGQIVDTMTIPNTAILSVSTDTMISNASDLLKWSRALYGKESTLLTPELQEQMLTFDDLSSYGLGVFQFQTPIGLSFGHGGDTAGYLSRMEYFPQQDLSIVILVNADASPINLSGLRDQLLATLFKVDPNSGVAQLLTDLRSADALVRKKAIIALGHSPAGSETVIQALIGVLSEDSSAENRKEAALALGFVGQNSDEVIQALNDALKDQDDSVRGAAAIALSILE